MMERNCLPQGGQGHAVVRRNIQDLHSQRSLYHQSVLCNLHLINGHGPLSGTQLQDPLLVLPNSHPLGHLAF